MPHKRSKFADRMADRAKKGNDLPPNNDLHFKSLPKGAMRIINAASIQAQYREKKKEREEELARKTKGKGKGEQGTLQIREGEKMGDFNRRVESTMAKDINKSIRATNETSKKRKRKGGAENEDHPSEEASTFASAKKNAVPRESNSKDLKRAREAIENGKGKEIEFKQADSRKRLNDVVQAPPNLTKAPRGESKSALERKASLKAALSGRDAETSTSKSARLPEPVLKGGLKREAMLREERERAVQAYRSKKQAQLSSRQ
ncbi:hypothetical protein CBS101457_000461 [Exobasidium rhododendri]|nr:hypothetical protein CBS101457_000461 [Exobasidium rhododendri]